MSTAADMLIERRRLRRRLAFWRILAILALLAAALVALAREAGAPLGPHVARVRIEGLIFDDPRRTELLARLARNDRVAALVLEIDSPGGTVVGSEALYEALRAVAAKKPVVAVMSEAAASGGYIAALAADRIVARGNTLTGSIGVVAEIPAFGGLLDKLGIEVTRVKSGPLKGEPNLVEPPDEAVLAHERALIADAHAWFRGLVAERRGLDAAALDEIADGRVLTGRQALALGLVDAIGGQETARAWLAEARGVAETLRVVDYNWEEESLLGALDAARAGLGRLLGRGAPVAPGPRLYAVIQG